MRTRLSSCTASFLLAGLVAALGGAGCSDDDDSGNGSTAGAAGSVSAGDDDDNDNATGGRESTDDDDDSATGGKQASGSGGAAGVETQPGQAGTGEQAGDTGTPSAAGQGGETGTPATPAEAGAGGNGTVASPDAILDDLIGAICDWEFKCCDDGERKFRLSPFITSAADCKERFIYELRDSNETDNPYVAGSPMGLLDTLGYVIDLGRVSVNSKGVQACIDQWNDFGCTTADSLKLPLNCSGPADATTDPCALSNLFSPTLALGAECTPALAQSSLGVNDIECVSGSSCIEDSATGRSTCIRRGIEGNPCTSDDGCDFDFYCNGEGRCTAKGDVGDACAYENSEEPVAGELSKPCEAGLSCNPDSEECVDNCSTGTLCTADSECPEGSSCAPLTVNDDTTSFHACRALGHAATARCDNAADCEAEWYCLDGVCAKDVELGDDCTDSSQCPEGTFCDDHGVCAAYSEPGEVCVRDSVTFASEQCGPDSLCIYDAELNDRVCSKAKLKLDAECQEDFDCASGLCERADEAQGLQCITGAEAGDDCDANVNTADALRCADGLTCTEEGTCVAQAGPGAACEAEAGGVGDPTLCASGDCREQWNTFMCSDQGATKRNGSVGLVCDGAD